MFIFEASKHNLEGKTKSLQSHTLLTPNVIVVRNPCSRPKKFVSTIYNIGRFLIEEHDRQGLKSDFGRKCEKPPL
jgi:hypothetical protein